VGVAPAVPQDASVFVHRLLCADSQEQLEGENDLNERAKRSMFSVMGDLKVPVTSAPAIADLNSIGAVLENRDPQKDNPMNFTPGAPKSLWRLPWPSIPAFLTGLMLLAGLILLAAWTSIPLTSGIAGSRTTTFSVETTQCVLQTSAFRT
jgi:hypothetical protein